MKSLFKAFLKYLLILLPLFVFFFLSIIIFYLLPIFKISIKENQLKYFIQSLSVPSFYHALYNSLIISVFLFGIIIFNYQKKYRFLAFFIPIIISSIIVFFVLYIFKPSYEQLNFNRIENAKVYFTPKAFFEHNGKKFYFESIEKNKIKNAIMINNNSVTFHHDCDVIFLEDRIFVNLSLANGKIKKIEFLSKQLNDYNIYDSIVSDTFFRSINNLTYKFIHSKYILANILLWIAIAFLIISFTTLIRIIHYPFLSIVYNFLFFILFYLFFNQLFDTYYKFFSDILTITLIRDLFLSIVLIILSIILQAIRIVFIKNQIWGNE